MHLPMNHPLNRVYRVAGAAVGVLLVVFAVLAYLANRDDVAGQAGRDVIGLRSNGVLAIILGLLGLMALFGALVGANRASTSNLVVGALLLLIGTIGLCTIRSPANILGIHVRTVIAMYIVGIVAATCGLYGRVSGGKLHNTATTSEQPFREDF